MRNIAGKYILAFDTVCTGWECVKDENNQPYLYDSFEEDGENYLSQANQ